MSEDYWNRETSSNLKNSTKAVTLYAPNNEAVIIENSGAPNNKHAVENKLKIFYEV